MSSVKKNCQIDKSFYIFKNRPQFSQGHVTTKKSRTDILRYMQNKSLFHRQHGKK